MDFHFVPYCSEKNKKIILYVGVALECDFPILEALFFTSLSTTAIDTTDSMKTLTGFMMFHVSCRIEDHLKITFLPARYDDMLLYRLPKGDIKILQSVDRQFVQVTIDPNYRYLYPYPLPYFTIHLLDGVFYSTESVAFLNIPFHQFDSLLDFHLDRLGATLK